MNELDRLDITYEVVLGVSAFQESAAALTTELTAPEVSQTIILTRTAGRTSFPRRRNYPNLPAPKTHCASTFTARRWKKRSLHLSTFMGSTVWRQ
jgi:precorrin-4/cobalt-precorrin-4 C11-methyltransferase